MATMLLNAFRPAIDALFTWNLSFSHRWRLLLLQPLAFLVFCIKVLPWSFSNAYTVHWIPTRAGRSIRCIVFWPPPRSRPTKPLRPLHLDIHGGGFMGGAPEYDAVFAQMTARRTGAVVLCATYRFAPVHPFPAAHDDIDDIVRYLHQHAEDKFGADPRLLTMSGFSAGGNLALSTSHLPECQPAEPMSTKAILLVYSPIDLRPPPCDKPRPKGFPSQDPLSAILPLVDSYVAPVRSQTLSNSRLHPILSPLDILPTRILLITPTVDILLDEQRTFVQRVQKEIEERGLDRQRTVQILEFEGAIHGWLELPSFAIDEKTRTQAFDAAIGFLREAHREHGWDWDES